MREPKAIAFAGDWHMNSSWARMAIDHLARVSNVDTIVHTGDYGYTFNDEFVERVERRLAKHEMMLYFVDGNHDNHYYLWELPLDEDGFGILSEHVRFIPRGHRWQWWGKTFLGLGGAYSVDRPARVEMIDWWPSEWVTDSEHSTAWEGGTVDVVVAHDCPRFVPIPGITRENGLRFFYAGDLDAADEHRRRFSKTWTMVKPKLYVHGHYHTRYTWENPVTRFEGLSEDATTMSGNLLIVTDKKELT